MTKEWKFYKRLIGDREHIERMQRYYQEQGHKAVAFDYDTVYPQTWGLDVYE